jgi:hypothetical protein
MELATIKELYDLIKAGEIDESRLNIVLDNDETFFNCDKEEIEIKEANGYNDVESLYRLLFPKATVEWV